MRHVITLSSIPPRFDRIGPALRSLLRQSSRPEAIELYIPRTYRRFPQWSGTLPQVPEGVRILRVDEDLGPATKILPAARAYRGQAIELIYVDDDHVYDRNWVQTCLDRRRSRPAAAICGSGREIRSFGCDWVSAGPLPPPVRLARSRRELWRALDLVVRQTCAAFGKAASAPVLMRRFQTSGYADIAEGFGGVMVQPDFFDDAAHAIPPVLWSVDDIWLSGQLARRGIPIWVDRDLYRRRVVPEASLRYPLFANVIEGADRDTANLACIDHMRRTYGIWGGAAVQST